MAGGAIIVANSCKLRQMIKKNQEEFLQKAECYIDEKLEGLDSEEKKTKKSAQ